MVSNDEASERLDPTRMRNQPSLRTSNGLIWLIVGGLFAAASLASLAMFVLAGEERSRTAAIVVAVIVIALYLLMFAARFGLGVGVTRLRAMAACMLAMAAVALLGLWVCGMLAAAAI